MNVFEQLKDYLQYPFVIHAIIVGVLIALCSALLGVSLVLKRFSYIGDGLSHVAFGGIAVAAVLNLTNDMPLILVVTIVSAIFLLKNGKKSIIKGDAAIAMLSVGTLAIGYLLMNVFAVSSNISGDVCTTLFGSTSILTLSTNDVFLCIVLSIIVIIVFILFYNKFFAVTFDEDFSNAVGVNAARYNLMIAIITAIIIVLAMKLVGSLLITALLIFPAISAMRVFKNYKAVVICAAIFAVLVALIGTLISIVAGTPVGSTIVAVDIVGFLIFFIIGKLRAI